MMETSEHRISGEGEFASNNTSGKLYLTLLEPQKTFPGLPLIFDIATVDSSRQSQGQADSVSPQVCTCGFLPRAFSSALALAWSVYNSSLSVGEVLASGVTSSERHPIAS